MVPLQARESEGLLGGRHSRGDRDLGSGCHVARNCKNASVQALDCTLFENYFAGNYQICCNNDNAADCWETEYCGREFTEVQGFSQTARRDIISKGNEHFSSLDSTHVRRADYQIKCSKRLHIIKLSTRYQIKRTPKALKFRNPDSCI